MLNLLTFVALSLLFVELFDFHRSKTFLTYMLISTATLQFALIGVQNANPFLSLMSK